MTPAPQDAVRKSVTVKASPERAFEIFTREHDSWWPRTHHIGKSPMTRNNIECRLGGRCYSEHEDGSQCDWGQVIAWEPPSRLVLAWMITHEWGYNPDLAMSSEVEVRFTPLDGGLTRVDLEHRYFSRMGPGGEAMRTAVDSGWPKILELFSVRCSG